MCIEIKNKLNNKYGDYWHCFYGKINDWYYRPTDSYVHFKFKEMDDKRLIIYRSKFSFCFIMITIKHYSRRRNFSTF